MDQSDRRIKESPIFQGEDEIVAYLIDTLPWGGSPSNASAVMKDSGGNDVSGTTLLGTCSINADVITTPAVRNLVPNAIYRIEVKFDIGGNTVECWGDVIGQE